MPEERGLYLRMPVIDQLVHFAVALRGAAPEGTEGGDGLARALPDRGPRRPPGRDPVQGQPAEGPVRRDHAPRPRRAADGRAVRRSRPGQRRAAQVRLPRAPRHGQDARVQHPPAGAGRGAVRFGGDHRPRADRRQRLHPGGASAPPVTRSSASRRRRTTGSTGWRAFPDVTVTRSGQRLHGAAGGGRPRPAGHPACGPRARRRGPPLRGRRSVAGGRLRRARRRARDGRGAHAGGARERGHEHGREHRDDRAPRVPRPGQDPQLRAGDGTAGDRRGSHRVAARDRAPAGTREPHQDRHRGHRAGARRDRRRHACGGAQRPDRHRHPATPRPSRTS